MLLKGLKRGRCNLGNCFKKHPGRKCQKGTITTLSSNCQMGKKKVCKITGNRKLCARMASLGVYPGREIEVICAGSDSQCIVKVLGGTVSLDSLTSNNILVESL